jgi:hypothetical protein
LSKDGLKAMSMVRDGMWIEIDVPIPMDDGLVLRADVYRPINEAYPVLAELLQQGVITATGVGAEVNQVLIDLGDACSFV